MTAALDKRSWRFSREDRAAMRQMRLSGFTQKQIARRFGCSRQYVQQITPAAPEHLQREDIERRFGCTKDQYDKLTEIGLRVTAAGLPRSKTPLGAWISQRNSARVRGIDWRIGAWDWWQIWSCSGKWGRRNRGRGYMMCRFGDTGPYSLDNVYIATGSHNASLCRRDRQIRTKFAEYRASTGKPLVKVADEFKVHCRTILRWESGSSRLPRKRLDEFSRITGIPPHELRPDLADIFLPRPKEAAE